MEADPQQLKKRHLDFIDIPLTARDETSVGMTDQETGDEVDTFIFAGHDTTASTISWTLYAFVKYSKMQQQIRNEVNNVLDNGRTTLQYDDLPNLQFMSRFTKETLRVFAPDGMTVPVGTEIAISQYNPAGLIRPR